MKDKRERGGWTSHVGNVLITVIVAILTAVVAGPALGLEDTVEVTVVDEGTETVVDTAEFTVGE